MAALTADRPPSTKDWDAPSRRPQLYPMAAGATIFAGAMVCLNANGFAVPAADTAGFSRVVGVAVARRTNSGADGAISVEVLYDAPFEFQAGASIGQADVGRDAFVQDDQTVADVAAATNDILVGRILEFNASTGKCWVFVE